MKRTYQPKREDTSEPMVFSRECPARGRRVIARRRKKGRKD